MYCIVYNAASSNGYFAGPGWQSLHITPLLFSSKHQRFSLLPQAVHANTFGYTPKYTNVFNS
jgi:hypothetical protein